LHRPGQSRCGLDLKTWWSDVTGLLTISYMDVHARAGARGRPALTERTAGSPYLVPDHSARRCSLFEVWRRSAVRRGRREPLKARVGLRRWGLAALDGSVAFAEDYNRRRPHKALQSMSHADVFFRRPTAILSSTGNDRI
jgi:hypothetical protein